MEKVTWLTIIYFNDNLIAIKGGERRDAKNLQFVAQHSFVASFGRCFTFFTLLDQLDPQQKHLLRVEEMRRADWLIC